MQKKHIAVGAKFGCYFRAYKKNSTTVHGVTEEGKVAISCASCCTTNIGPIIEIHSPKVGIKKKKKSYFGKT